MNGKTDTGCIASRGSTIAVVDRAGTLYLSTEFGRAVTELQQTANPKLGSNLLIAVEQLRLAPVLINQVNCVLEC